MTTVIMYILITILVFVFHIFCWNNNKTCVRISQKISNILSKKVSDKKILNRIIKKIKYWVFNFPLWKDVLLNGVFLNLSQLQLPLKIEVVSIKFCWSQKLAVLQLVLHMFTFKKVWGILFFCVEYKRFKENLPVLFAVNWLTNSMT